MKFLPRGAAALAVAALFPVMAAAQQTAQQTPEPRVQGPQRRVMQQRPQLTEQQREQLRTFDEQHRQSVEATRRELGDLHRQLDEALTGAQLDQSKINSLRSSIVQKETALAQARVDRLTKLSSVLTAEQRQAFRGRGLGQLSGFGGGRRGMISGRAGGGGRGVVMARPGGGRGMRGGAQGQGGAIIQRRQGIERQLQTRRPAPRASMMRGGSGGGDVERLRAEIRRLEAQIEALRRRIR